MTEQQVAWVIDIFEGGNDLIWDREPNHGPAPAREAHTSAVFRARAVCAECMYDAPVVFTAEHGFLHLDAIIPNPYDPSFTRPGVVSLETLRKQVHDYDLDRCHSAIIEVSDPVGRALAAEALAGTQVAIVFAPELTEDEVIRTCERCAAHCL
jgi:hypothetical protein